MRLTQCWVVLGTPLIEDFGFITSHAQSTACTYCIGAVKSDVVHRIVVCLALWLQSGEAEQIVHIRWPRHWQQALGRLVRKRHKDSLPDVISYRSAISASDQCEQWQQTLVLLVEMRHNDLLPDVISYKSAISACVKSGKWHHALGLLLRRRHNDLLPDVITCSCAISVCEKGEKGNVQWDCS